LCEDGPSADSAVERARWCVSPVRKRPDIGRSRPVRSTARAGAAGPDSFASRATATRCSQRRLKISDARSKTAVPTHGGVRDDLDIPVIELGFGQINRRHLGAGRGGAELQPGVHNSPERDFIRPPRRCKRLWGDYITSAERGEGIWRCVHRVPDHA
jgi:hypothetical protein